MTYSSTDGARDARRFSPALMVGAAILVVGVVVFALSLRGDGGAGQVPASSVDVSASPSASVAPSVEPSLSATGGAKRIRGA